MEQYLVRLSKEMSEALRHTPWLYELELDRGNDMVWLADAVPPEFIHAPR